MERRLATSPIRHFFMPRQNEILRPPVCTLLPTARMRMLRTVLLTALSVCAGACLGGELITIRGLAPPGIDRWDLTEKYYRFYGLLAPHAKPSASPILVDFFRGEDAPEAARGLPEWGGGGVVDPDRIVVPVDRKPFQHRNFAQVTTHELVHIVLLRAYRRTEIPRWVHEGIAMMLSGEVPWSEHIIISRAIFTGNLLSLDRIDSVNSFGRVHAQLAYSQSRQAVRYLIDTWGMEVLPEILRNAQREGSFREGLYATLALRQEELESFVRSRLVKDYRFVFLLADTYLIWIAIAVLFIAAVVAARIRNARRMESEPLSEAAGNGEFNDEQT